MIKLHVHNDLLGDFEQYKQQTAYCIPKGKTPNGVNFDIKFNWRTVAEELRFCRKFEEFKARNREAWKKTLEQWHNGELKK